MRKAKNPSVLIIRTTPLLEPRVQRIASALSEIKLKVNVFLWDRGDLGEVPSMEQKNNYTVYRYKHKVSPEKTSLLFSLPRWWLNEAIAILKFKPKIIHAGDLFSAIPAILLSKILKSKVIYDIFDFYSEMSLDGKPMVSYLQRLVKWVEQVIIRLVDVVIVPHEYQIFLMSTARPKLMVDYIYHSPSISECLTVNSKNQFFSKNKPLILLYSGLLGKGRGIYELVKIAERIDNVTVVICGFGSEAKAIKKLSEKVKNLTYLGFVSRQEQLQWMIKADIMAIMYDPNISVYKVASPSKLYEAMIFGKPVIVSKGTVAEKIVVEENCGVSTEYGNIDDLVNAVLLLAKDEKLREKLGNNAKQSFYRKYDWEISKQKLVKIYEKLI
jgi:glycosyltransferase involved in cell wall biosynthesis